ncbi:hypothetical protein C2S51_028932 [Perilla frutescens var. frutescens]|nr:hypothetical protein C2S51_028932 [Perilla frutescens var. frutescens]
MGQNAPGNNQMLDPSIQKQLAHACASEITLAIINDIGDRFFTLLVDETRDISVKEQISRCLKDAIDALFARHSLSISKLRGQGYDGASNMRGEFNGLKSLILEENPCAMYVHYFAHQLQLTIVAVAKGNDMVQDFFTYVSMVVNTTGASCKRRDQLTMLEHNRLINELNNGERVSGRGQNQESNLSRPGDTRWGSYYLTLICLCSLCSSVEQVLHNVRDEATLSESRSTAKGLIDKLDSYEFIFVLHLMKFLLGVTHELSLSLQQKDQNIIQAMTLIDTVKCQLQNFREDGWEEILQQVGKFCELNGIAQIDMDANISRRGHKKKGAQAITNLHYYHVEIFYQVVDLIIQEINNHFSEANTELHRCIACLDPKDSYSRFNVDQLMHLTHFYPRDFSTTDCLFLPQQLSNYIVNVRRDPQFSTISNLGMLAQEMVKSGKSLVFPLVYRMIELALVLPIATASVERVFSAMKIVKTDLRNRMADEWMNDILVVYIKRDMFLTIENKLILQRFQSMDTRRFQLSPLPQISTTTTSPSVNF